MSARLTLPVLRRLLQDAPWAQARLQPFAGHEVAWEIAGLTGSLLIDETGLPAAVPADGADTDARGSAVANAMAPGASGKARPGVRLTLAADDLSALAQGFEGLMRKVSLQGNAALAAELAFIAGNLRPDPEEWLAPWLGDVLAERTGQGLRAGARWTMQAGRRLASAGSEYLVHEAGLLPTVQAVEAHCADVDTVREAADRLQQRLVLLERRMAAQRPPVAAPPGHRQADVR